MQTSPTMGGAAQAPVSKAAVIGSGIEITGEVTASADLVVNGVVNGPVVQSSHNIEIGESGQVNARIRAKLVKISGEVNGDVSGIEKVLISRTGRVRGNIVAPRVQLEDGAIFKGSIDMTPAQTTKPDVPADKVKATKPSTGTNTGTGTTTTQAKSTAPRVSGSALVKDSGRKEPSLTLKSG